MTLASLSYTPKKFFGLNWALWLLLLTVILTFRGSSLLEFYIFFESSLIPIFFIIILWGYQPERFKARLILLFYTSIASLPLLLILLRRDMRTFYTTSVFYKVDTSSFLKNITQFRLVLAVLVKIPIFGPHQWLPKAHVEAPVEGSMVLAAILLKLGGYGLLRIVPFTLFRSTLANFLLRLSLIGSTIIRIVCLYQFDIKVLIAYSSVAHIRLVIVPLLLKSSWGLAASLRIMVAHGSASSLLFAIRNLIYKISSRRRTLFSKGTLLALPCFSTCWFLACAANMAGPFTFNLLAELVAVVRLIKVSLLILVPFGLIIFIAAGYSLGLYALTQHGSQSFSTSKVPGLNSIDLSIIITHLYFTYLSAIAICLFF